MWEQTVTGDAQIWNLIDRQDFPESTGSQSIIFEDLLGNDTGAFKLKYHLFIHADGDNRNIALR